MQIHKNEFTSGFVNTFDEYNENKRKLFGIPQIDELLSFEHGKNICIVNNSDSKEAFDFLYSLIVKVCVNFHMSENKNKKKADYYSNNNNTLKNKKIMLIDAGNGNNLGYQYLKLLNKSLNYEFNIENILNEIIIVRAFTFYQILNIIINELPNYVLQPINNNNSQLQIIIVNFLDTLITSSSKINAKDKYSNPVLTEITR